MGALPAVDHARAGGRDGACEPFGGGRDGRQGRLPPGAGEEPVGEARLRLPLCQRGRGGVDHRHGLFGARAHRGGRRAARGEAALYRRVRRHRPGHRSDHRRAQAADHLPGRRPRGLPEQHLLPLPMRDAAHPDGAAAPLPAFAGGTGRLLRAGSADPVARACTAARPLGREDRRRGHLGRARFGARPARGGARGRSARPSARQRAGGDNARLRHDRSHEGQRGTPLRTARRELLLRGYRGRGRRALPRHRSGPRPARRDL